MCLSLYITNGALEARKTEVCFYKAIYNPLLQKQPSLEMLSPSEIIQLKK